MEGHTGDQESLQKEVVLIDSLLSIDQHKSVERTNVAKKHTKDITEVAAAAEALLPKGSARILTAVKLLIFHCSMFVCLCTKIFLKVLALKLEILHKVHKRMSFVVHLLANIVLDAASYPGLMRRIGIESIGIPFPILPLTGSWA